jgi:hypothetical protein
LSLAVIDDGEQLGPLSPQMREGDRGITAAWGRLHGTKVRGNSGTSSGLCCARQAEEHVCVGISQPIACTFSSRFSTEGKTTSAHRAVDTYAIQCRKPQRRLQVHSMSGHDGALWVSGALPKPHIAESLPPEGGGFRVRF